MRAHETLAVLGAFFVLGTAMPLHHKRDILVVTETHDTVVTVPVTVTVWVGAEQSAPTVHAAATEPAPTAVHSQALAAPSLSIAPSPSVAAAISVAATSVAPTVPAVVATSSPPPTSAAVLEPTSPAAIAPLPVPSSASSSGTTSTSGAQVDDLTSGLAAAGVSYVGDVTYYDTGVGACGVDISYSENAVAVSHTIFDSYLAGVSNPNNNPICGQWVEITGVDGSIYPARVLERCPGCDEGSLDLPEGFFNEVTNNGNGRVHNIHWRFAGSGN